MIQTCEGVVIRTTNYGESNKIIVIYSREFGKLGMMARGAKKPNSRFSAASQLFIHATFTFYQGSGLGTLRHGDMMTSFRNIREDIFKTAYASYIVELLDKATEEKKANPYLFELLMQTLTYINEDYDREIVTNIFEMKMLPVFGLYPVMNECVVCASKEGRFAFSIRENGLLCHKCFTKDPYHLPLSQSAIKLLRLFYYFDIHRLGSISVKPETKREIRKAINLYYDEFSGLRLKSKRFLEQMDRLNDMM